MAIEELEEVPRKWEEMKKALHDRFEPAGLEEKHRSELLARRRKDSETLAQYVSELRRLGKLAYPLFARSQREDFLKDVFVRQGSDSFREATLTQRMGTLTDVVQLAERHESGMRDITHCRQASKSKVRFDSPVEKDRREAPPLENQFVCTNLLFIRISIYTSYC